MGLCIEDLISVLTISQSIYEAALVMAILRWVFFWGFKFIRNRRKNRSLPPPTHPSPLPSSSFGDIIERLPESWDTCAVCLNQLRMEDEVRQLPNCCHVFHRECIDRWLEHDHDNFNPTCPLCRALLHPFYSSSIESCSSCVPVPQPSWAVERLLYLFGDDLLL